jgi:hypothetical protein
MAIISSISDRPPAARRARFISEPSA